MPIRSSSMGGTPFGDTANRPSSPQVGQTYYNGELGYLEIYTTSGWTAAVKAIPFGNTSNRPSSPQIGQPYFNGQESRLELYTTSTGWQNIVQETPSVVSIVGQLNETTTSTITINGTNFAAGAIAYVVGVNGVETSAITTTLVSVVEITATFQALSPSNGPYDVKVVNPSNLYGVLYETLGVNDQPVWTTAAGSLGTFTELDSISITISASDASDSTNSPLAYSIVSGSLPTGLTLSSSGIISGNPSNVVSSTTYSFTVSATDGRNTAITRSFSITISDRNPTWTTSTTLPIFTRNSAYSTTIAATDDDSGTVTYSLVSGSLPTGLTLSSSGTISGTPTSATTSTFTARATVTVSGTTSDRTFTMPNAAPVWSTSGTLSTMISGGSYSQQITANDDSGVAPTYSLVSGTFPSGISISSSGLISGTAGSITGYTNVNYTFRATDANGNYTDQILTIPQNEALYTFTAHTFTNAGQTGRTGPSLSQVQSSYSSASWAQNTSYLNTSSGVQLWTVPKTGTYRISAAGARGGYSDDGSSGNTRPGYGASMAGDFSLTAGEVIKILVGQAGAALTDNATGSNPGGGGGGGSYVVKNDNTALLVAAGGHGESWTSWNTSGPDGLTTNSGTGGGAGGGRCGGGGGFSGNGGNATSEVGSTGGLSFLNGGTGGQGDPSTYSGQNHGGFGGGGGAKHEGAGGGGYTGGSGVGVNDYNNAYTSYGAGSYNTGTNQSNSGGANNGYGYVTITKL